MKPSEIQVGRTYRNRGAGRTLRKVKAIGPECLPKQAMNGDGKFPDGAVGVLYDQIGPGQQVHNNQRLWLKSFATWAGSDVPNV